MVALGLYLEALAGSVERLELNKDGIQGVVCDQAVPGVEDGESSTRIL